MDINKLIQLETWDIYLTNHLISLIEKCLQLMPSKDGYTIIDVGANTGRFVQLLLEIEQIKINKAILFEPVPEYVFYIKKKLAYHPNILVHNCALSDTNGMNELFVSTSKNIGWNTMVKEKINIENETSKIMIEERVFDDMNFNLENIDLIKIDTEGYEYKVLAGFINTLKRLENKPLILCEIGWGTQHPYFSQLKEVLEIIFEIGYNRVEIKNENTHDIYLIPKVK